VLQDAPHLTALGLYTNTVGDGGARQLGEFLKAHAGLERLDINRNGIKQQGAEALAGALQTNSSLTWLDVGSNPLGGEGIRAITEAIESNLSSGVRDLRLAQTCGEEVLHHTVTPYCHTILSHNTLMP
jgi:Ran GTPase-activating protein (RanGAP) involved in mRNA processing and transport